MEVQLTDGNKIYNTVTDQNGRASFNVETPPFYTSQIVSPAAQPFTQVNILISAPGYVSVRVVNLMVFPLTETTFTQNMILLAGSPYGSVRTVVTPRTIWRARRSASCRRRRSGKRAHPHRRGNRRRGQRLQPARDRTRVHNRPYGAAQLGRAEHHRTLLILPQERGLQRI